MRFKVREELEIGYTVKALYSVVLGLSGAEREVYAFVRSFSHGSDKLYFGGYEFMAAVTGYSVTAVGRAVRSLVKRGFIIRDVIFGKMRDTVTYRADVERERAMVAAHLTRERKRIAIDRGYDRSALVIEDFREREREAGVRREPRENEYRRENSAESEDERGLDVSAERERIKALDGLAGKVDNALIDKAKYGEVKMSAAECEGLASGASRPSPSDKPPESSGAAREDGGRSFAEASYGTDAYRPAEDSDVRLERTPERLALLRGLRGEDRESEDVVNRILYQNALNRTYGAI